MHALYKILWYNPGTAAVQEFHIDQVNLVLFAVCGVPNNWWYTKLTVIYLKLKTISY